MSSPSAIEPSPTYLTNLRRAPFSDEKVRKVVEAAVHLEAGETMIAAIDTAALRAFKEGLVVTDRRLIRYDKDGARTIAREDFESVVFTEKFPYPVRLNHKNGTVVLPGCSVKGGREICHLIRAAVRGDVAAATAPPPEGVLEPRAAPVVATPVSEVFKVFHGRAQTDASSDLGMLLGVLFFGPLVLGGFWLGARGEGLTAGFFKVTLALGVLGWPFLLWDSWKSYRTQGPRKVVYCVSPGQLVKGVLRGESHPLWSATEASPPIPTDQIWRRDAATVFLRQGAIVVEWRHSALVSGSMTLDVKISPDEFDDPAQFDGLVDALALRVLP